MLTWNLDSCHGRNAVGRENQRTDSGHLQRCRNCTPSSLQSSSKIVSIFDKRIKRLQNSQEPKSTGELDMVWKSHVYRLYEPNVYV